MHILLVVAPVAALLSLGLVKVAIGVILLVAAVTAPVDLTPLLTAVVPLVVAVVGTLLSWALHKIAVKFHLDALDAHRDVLTAAIENGIALALKRVPPTFSADARIVMAANYVLPKVPDALAALKVTPDSLRSIIAAKLP